MKDETVKGDVTARDLTQNDSAGLKLDSLGGPQTYGEIVRAARLGETERG